MTRINKSIPIDVSELAEKYGLPEGAVREEIERSVSMALTSTLGCEVEAGFNDDDSFEVLAFREVQGEINTQRLRDIPWNQLASLKETIEQNLYERVVFCDYEKFKHLANTLVYGTVSNIGGAGELIVQIDTGLHGGVIGICSLRQQPPSERGNYFRDEHLPFYVLKVRAAHEEDETPRLVIPLSRTSKRLVELLLKEEILHANIRCIRRIAGAISFVWSDKPLPRELILKVSETLNERIKVRWASSS